MKFLEKHLLNRTPQYLNLQHTLIAKSPSDKEKDEMDYEVKLFLGQNYNNIESLKLSIMKRVEGKIFLFLNSTL